MFSINRLLLLFKQITKLQKLDMMGKAVGFYEEIAHFCTPLDTLTKVCTFRPNISDVNFMCIF